ncbi:peptidase inhibitor family I36 protein [Actinomadura rubrisoli]|nr:peptidase inhibitor family I36 protein [Actinomadura rubrisoli]
MWRTLSRVSLALSVAASAAVLTMSPASASAAPAGCSANSLCGWSGSNFTGPITTFGAGAGCLNSPIPLRSVANTHPGGVGVPVVLSVYSGQDCSGKPLGSVAGGQSLPSLPGVGVSVMSVW